MATTFHEGFRFEDWRAYPSRDVLLGPRGEVHIEPKVMQLLEYLAREPGKVFERDELLEAIWDGRAITDEPLSRCVFQLRRALGDSARNPRYIETIPKRGFRLLCDVQPLSGVRLEVDGSAAEATTEKHGPGFGRRRMLLYALVGILIVASVGIAYRLTSPTLTDAPDIRVEGAKATSAPAYSVAVLPFENLSERPEDRYFVDGLHDEVLTQLTKLSSLEKVIAQTTMEQYRNTAKPVSVIGRELDVAAVLEGGVQRAGDWMRINVQLTAVGSDQILWAESYDRQLTVENLFEVQGQIARHVASSLVGKFTLEESDRLGEFPTHSLEAYEEYLYGKQGIRRATSESLLQAAAHLERAVGLDPSFAEAQVALAEAYWTYRRHTFGKLPEGVTEDSIKRRIDMALELDPTLGFAYAMRGRWLAGESGPEGWYLPEGNPEAEREFQKAVELSPGDPDIYLAYGDFEQDRERKVELYRQGLRVDPQSARLHHEIGYQLFELFQPDAAFMHFAHAIEYDPDSWKGYWGVGVLNWYYTGRIDEAMRWLRIAYSKDRGNINNICLVGWTYLWLNDDVAAEQWFRHAMHLAPRDSIAVWGLADVYRIRGQLGEEWRLLRELPDDGALRKLYHLVQDGRSDEAFEQARMRMPELFGNENDNTGRYRSNPRHAVIPSARKYLFFERIFRGLGETERAAELLANMEMYVDNRMVSYGWDYRVRAQIHAARGRNDDAIEALRNATDSGNLAWWPMLFDGFQFDGIRGDPRFKALLDSISDEMAVQLERVREMERNGEIPMLPGDA